MKVIISIDDDRLITMMLNYQLNKHLKGEHLLIETINNPKQAIEMAHELFDLGFNIPLIITDFQMPGLNGLKVIEAIKEFSPQTKFILLSGQVNGSILDDLIQNEKIDRLIFKPWKEEDLIMTIESLLTKELV